MRKFILGVVVAISFAGCSSLQNAYDVVTGVSVSPVAVYVAANSFDAAEATATNYLRLKRCSTVSGPVCRSPVATTKIIPAVRSGRIARDRLTQFQKDNPSKLGPTGLYNALTSATAALQSIYQQYGVAQ